MSTEQPYDVYLQMMTGAVLLGTIVAPDHDTARDEARQAYESFHGASGKLLVVQHGQGADVATDRHVVHVNPDPLDLPAQPMRRVSRPVIVREVVRVTLLSVLEELLDQGVAVIALHSGGDKRTVRAVNVRALLQDVQIGETNAEDLLDQLMVRAATHDLTTH